MSLWIRTHRAPVAREQFKFVFAAGAQYAETPAELIALASSSPARGAGRSVERLRARCPRTEGATSGPFTG